MSPLNFSKSELAAAIARGVQQCVVIGSQPRLLKAFKISPNRNLQVFAVDEKQPADSQAAFVPTQFVCETLSAALEKSEFNKLKASLFVWLGGAGYRSLDAVLASLAFIASLPRGSGVILDYAVERTSRGSLTYNAIDALASRILLAGGSVKQFIRPQAVAAMLHGLGFQQVEDQAEKESLVCGEHLVSALV